MSISFRSHGNSRAHSLPARWVNCPTDCFLFVGLSIRFVGSTIVDLMDKELAQFKLEDGTAFLVEVDKPVLARGETLQRVALVDTNKMVYEAKQTLEEALDKVRPVAEATVKKLKSGLTQPADEIEVTFGLKLNAEAGVVFGSVGGEVTFEVKLKWQKDKD